jgi:nucleoside-diphosphate-sugar epimerase
MQRVLVTGAGIVGSHIAQRLVQQGHDVVLLDLDPKLSHISSIVDVTNINIVKADVTDATMLATLAEEYQIEGVIHTAVMLTGPSQQAPARSVAVNVGGAVNVMELARCGLVRRVILVGSTSHQYPTFNRPRSSCIPENFQIDIVSQAPRSVYSATKLAMEFLAWNFVDSFGVDVGVVRCAAVLGAWSGPNAGLMSRLVTSLLGAASRGETAFIDDRSQVWEGVEEFIDARDCAAGAVAALFAPALTSRVYHLTNPTGYTFDQFVEAVKAICPRLRVQKRVTTQGGLAGFPWARTALSDISAARRELGYSPTYSLHQSLEHIASLSGV